MEFLKDDHVLHLVYASVNLEMWEDKLYSPAIHSGKHGSTMLPTKEKY
jgi:hypothetical protein